MRARSAFTLVALLGVTAFMASCGSKFELPTERKLGRTVPSNGSYQMLATWRTGMSGIQDLLLTQGLGTQLFLLFNHGGAGAAPRGEVLDYFLSRPNALGHSMQGGLFNPVALAAGGDGFGGTVNRVYVLDQGDTLLAKHTYFACDTCPGQRWIADLSKYWRVREYGLLGGDTVSTLTDTTVGFVNGIAADAEGSVYVSGVAIVKSPASDPRLTNRDYIYRIYKYRRGPRYPGIVPDDGTMPGARWHRDTTYFHTSGSGVGYINDPRGMVWSSLPTPALFVSDRGNNSGQKLSDTDTTGYFRFEQDGDGSPLTAPQDISVDGSGFVYVCDTGNRRVLRFDPSGAFVQRVDIEANDLSLPLDTPVAVAANDSIAYVADRGRGEVIRYQRRK